MNMEYLITLAILVALFVYDRYIRKKPPYTLGKNNPSDIGDADRGHKQ